eukprot:scaffold8165_cov116-Isochrysis_galbana.AAC.5
MTKRGAALARAGARRMVRARSPCLRQVVLRPILLQGDVDALELHHPRVELAEGAARERLVKRGACLGPLPCPQVGFQDVGAVDDDLDEDELGAEGPVARQHVVGPPPPLLGRAGPLLLEGGQGVARVQDGHLPGVHILAPPVVGLDEQLLHDPGLLLRPAGRLLVRGRRRPERSSHSGLQLGGACT